MTDVERLADRIVMLHGGRVLLDDTLDDLRESFSLALIPHAPGLDRERVLGMERCVAVRERPDAFHAILRLEPARARTTLEANLPVGEVLCRSIALEDMFIEVAGGQ